MGTVTEDDSIAVVVVGESALELRAGDANGKVLVSVPVKDGNVDEAQVALDAAAAKLGYVFVPTTDATEMAEAAEMFVLSALLANRDLLGSHSLAAFESAVKAVDLARMADLIESLFEARSVEGLDGLADLVEGLRTKAKTKGRKPSGKTMVRKATTKSPALPVSTGPGQRHGGRVGGAADAGQGKAIIPPAQNPASHKDTPSGTRNQDVDWVKEEWVDSIRRMSVEEFTGHMLEAATVDSDDRFALRVAALTEAYKGPGKKDIAKKITAANPVIKKRAGKGLNLEAIQSEGTTVIEFARARVNEFLAVSKEVGAGSDAEVRMTNEAVSVRLPKAIAAKVLAVFTGDDVKVDAE